MIERRVIEIHAEAPPLPAFGTPCNGCGLCCLAEPCPLGMWVSRRRTGACRALQWEAEARRYRCGVVAEPQRFVPAGLQRLAPLLSRLARRWISAGSGCDAHLETEVDSPP
ncbi:hypothetical protein PSQ20_07965 [Curvibacter sp. RS43]|uniref:hypothetical protein n=1 Tax=Curvibacter microcysteis TaxID=3026419 RepID=UPI002361F159|nr:hypothetical protein [Curvibacter sp. RS43]MDD0810266.1 hypothetical protein [Curvibacter sp. RS43]